VPRIGPDLVGHALDEIEWAWTDRDAMLYALSVGARLPEDLPFLYESFGPRVAAPFPLAGVTLALPPLVSELGIDLKDLLHVSQSVDLRRVPEPVGRAVVRRRVTGVWDKGRAAIVDVEDEVVDGAGGAGGAVLAVARSSWWVAGAGGFGGERGVRAAGAVLPTHRPADLRVTIPTSPEQAALHRLVGDRNPVHIDPELARAAGQPRPFLHGLCTLGAVGHALDRAAGRHRRLASLTGRFAHPVFPGDTLFVEAWEDGDGAMVARVRVRDVVVVDGVRGTYVDAS
jgi:acyl dehydratase